jgi:exodeoxyribonuclease VII small subunit
MPSNPSESLPDPQTMSYEQAIAELEAINTRIERGEISLEESLAAYRRGVALAKRCNSILETAEQEVKKITATPGGEDSPSEA